MKDEFTHETWSGKCIAIVVGLEDKFGRKNVVASCGSYRIDDYVPVAVDRTHHGV